MKGNSISSDFDVQHPLVTKLIVATQSGDAANVKRLLKNAVFSVVRAKAASLALGAIDPLDNQTLSADRLWRHKAHKVKDKRPNKRALHCVWQRIVKSIDLLLDAGAEPDTVDHEGCSSLCKMVNHRELTSIVQRMLLAGADSNCHDASGASAVYLAVMYENEEAVRLLLEYGADPNKSYEELTPLMFAAANQQLVILQRLINAGADLNCRDKDGRTALMHALNRHADHPFLVMYRWAREAEARRCPKKDSYDITQLLVNSGADYEEADDMGFVPLDYALLARLKGVELPTELTLNQTLLKFCEAAMNGDSSQLAALLVAEEIPARIKTIALTLAAVRGFEECCAVLLENGADPNKADQCGITPAKAAVTGLQLTILRLLVAHGLSKDELSVALTDLCMALAHYYEEDESTFHTKKLALARYLLEQGADPNVQDKDLGGLLTIATLFEKNVELVRMLLEFGAVPPVEE